MRSAKETRTRLETKLGALLLVQQLTADIRHLRLEKLEGYQILAVRGADADELNINSHAKRIVALRNCLGIILLRD